MNPIKVVLNYCRKLFRTRDINAWHSEKYVQYFGQNANDYVRESIRNAKGGFMIAKFGTVELSNVCANIADIKKLKSLKDYWWYIRGYQSLWPKDEFQSLCANAGFFPNNPSLSHKWTRLVLDDIRDIDILGSYCKQEERLEKKLNQSVKVDLDGYYAPFLWENPWTMELAGKKVLVVHPFTESIKVQYDKRKLLFGNQDVLPEFKELILIKAVQSIAGNGESTGFKDWFEALDYMKAEISKQGYDIALIGCGAYGLHLAAHVKREGKIAVHLAGWTQMLFGIYGNRWLNDQPQYAKYINEYWIRPLETETPKDAQSIENACYW